jgi:hypothetical protein
MGVTIFYRGSVTDLDRIEDFEDRALDLALELDGQARIWRTCDDHDRQRLVRGVVLNLYPGQEPTSLLIAPEGWLINLSEIEEAEKGELAGPPWCFVKTQFGPLEGHVALIEMLAALKREFFLNLEVRDEGEYWETRNLATLAAKRGQVQVAISEMAEGMRRYGLSREAAEDHEILAARIERVARLVQRTLARPAEHPPVLWDDASLHGVGEGSEAQWDAAYRENRRRQEHLRRAIEEHLARGAEIGDAFEAAMLEETSLGLPDDSPQQPLDDGGEPDEADEPWKESLPALPNDEHAELAECGRHPLQQRALDLMLRLHKMFSSRTTAAKSHQDLLLHAAGEMLGGLAQSLGTDDSQPAPGLSVVQLKRALRGAAFSLGALFPLRAVGTPDETAFNELRETIQCLQTDMYAELSRLRQQCTDEF